MAKKKEITVENKLRALYDLQLIDSRVDTIRSVRGELPLEVQDLEDEVAGLTIRLEKLTDSVDTLNDQIKMKKNLMEEAKALIKKYTEQQKNVRNNRCMVFPPGAAHKSSADFPFISSTRSTGMLAERS